MNNVRLISLYKQIVQEKILVRPVRPGAFMKITEMSIHKID